jgi:hypothetical protein
MNHVEDRMTYFQISNRALLQNLVASALVLAGATACSRTDRSESGSNTGAATTQDTAITGGSQMSSGIGRDSNTMNSTRDTAISGGTQTGVSTGDTVPAKVQSNKPRSKTGTTAAERRETMGREDTASACYRGTQGDTATGNSDSARVT